MRFTSYWQDTAPAFGAAHGGPVEGHYDVAVVGGGFTGLSAARHLAREGARVVVLDAAQVGFGASSRNGGHLNNGLAHSYVTAKAELGTERAQALWRAFDQSIDTIERIVAEENIDCSFRRGGKLKLASKPAHFDAMARTFEVMNREIDPDTRLLGKAELKDEIGSTAFYGAVLHEKSAMMHVGRFVVGLAEAAVRHGATVFEGAPVIDRRAIGGGHELVTSRGRVRAEQVLVATGAYTAGPFAYFRRRIVPIGSFIIATRPLTESELATTLPGDRTYVTSLNIGNYFRLSPDRRLIWGGRARFSARSDQQSDQKSGRILRESLARILPHLAKIEIDYCWGGMIDVTKDRFPRAGRVDSTYFAMGYSGHGAQLSTYMGIVMADIMLGRQDRNPVAGLKWPAIPGHSGKPWFLPMVGAYYKLLDRFQ